MIGAMTFSVFVKISSYPCEFFYFKELIIFSVSLVDVFLNFILEKDYHKISQ